MLYTGWQAANSGRDPGIDFSEELELDVAALQLEIERLNGDLEVERSQHEVDRGALELVREEMASQRKLTAGLEEDLRFYRSLMAPESLADSISIRSPEIVEHVTPGQFSYRIVIQQEAKRHALVEGVLSVDVSGILAGQEINYPLTALSDDLGDAAVMVQFLYFQTFEGDLSLPPGFEPKMIVFRLNASKPSIIEVREQFPWLLQERFKHAGK
jgi:hypothetical protein